MKDFAKMLSQKIKDYQKKIVAMPQEYTLEQSLNFFDKASLRNIAEDKKIPYRTNDTKASLVKKIHSYIAKPKVIEAYFLHMPVAIFKTSEPETETFLRGKGYDLLNSF